MQGTSQIVFLMYAALQFKVQFWVKSDWMANLIQCMHAYLQVYIHEMYHIINILSV